ncbi:uncharacterized protein BJX67DRAFT_359705 [Aspergillus lucknowensis]|uniref:Actin n=1 Tax=Aspergillus lucknowensis TaxID=176173 RepID=A0ABR4LKE8_9EURO
MRMHVRTLSLPLPKTLHFDTRLPSPRTGPSSFYVLVSSISCMSAPFTSFLKLSRAL